jgi:DNA-binding HxlR family transcriptional regulator
MREANQPRSECPINAAIEVFGDRWSLIVLRDIVFGDRRYFRELQAGSIEGIASNILADRLKRLVKSGLLTREDTRPGQRARYSLTEPAIQLIPVFAQLGSWGLRHRPTSSALNARAELLEQGGPALWQEFMDELRHSHLGSDISPRSPSVRERLNAAYLAAANSSSLPGSRPCPRAPADAARAVSHVNLHRHSSGAGSRRRPAR